MKILTVTTGNILPISAFISDHLQKLEERSYDVNCFLVKGKGINGYLSNVEKLSKAVDHYKPDLIHAHYGLSGLLSTLQRKVPVVTTFHGSDINLLKVRAFSYMAYIRSDASIFVSNNLASKIGARKYHFIPCGVDFNVFKPMERSVAREYFGLDKSKKYILFSSHFSNEIKNYALAEKAVGEILGEKPEILELKGYSREEVSQLMNAVDLALMTSRSEGSPQFIKEAMACNVPIVSTDVGDVRELMGNTNGCYICNQDSKEIANSIQEAMNFNQRTEGRKSIEYLNLENITEQIIKVYKTILS